MKAERKGPHGGLISAVFFRKTIIIEVGQLFYISCPALVCPGTGEHGGQGIFCVFPEIDGLVEMTGKALMGECWVQFVFCAGATIVDINHIPGGIVKGCSKIKRWT